MEIFTAFAGELERSIAWGSGGFYYPWWCGSPGTEKEISLLSGMLVKATL
jgi:hypothetical protein